MSYLRSQNTEGQTFAIKLQTFAWGKLCADIRWVQKTKDSHDSQLGVCSATNTYASLLQTHAQTFTWKVSKCLHLQGQTTRPQVVQNAFSLLSCQMLRRFQVENTVYCEQMDLCKFMGLSLLHACTSPSFGPLKQWGVWLDDFTGSHASILSYFDPYVLYSFSLGCSDREEFHLPLHCSAKQKGPASTHLTELHFASHIYPYFFRTGVPAELEITRYLLPRMPLSTIWYLMNHKSRYLLIQRAEDLSNTQACLWGWGQRTWLPKAATTSAESSP